MKDNYIALNVRMKKEVDDRVETTQKIREDVEVYQRHTEALQLNMANVENVLFCDYSNGTPGKYKSCLRSQSFDQNAAKDCSDSISTVKSWAPTPDCQGSTNSKQLQIFLATYEPLLKQSYKYLQV